VSWEDARGTFTPVYVNETLTLDFATATVRQPPLLLPRKRCRVRCHLRPRDRIRDHVSQPPNGPSDMRIKYAIGRAQHLLTDANTHIWEILTVSYARPDSSTAAAPSTSS